MVLVQARAASATWSLGRGLGEGSSPRGVYCTLPPQERDAHRTALDGLGAVEVHRIQIRLHRRSIVAAGASSLAACRATLKTSRGGAAHDRQGAAGSPSLVEHAAAVDADDVGALLTAAQAPLASMPASAPPGAAGHAVPGGFRGGRQAAGVAFASASARLVARSAVQVVLADVEGSAVASGVPDAVALDGEWLEVTKGRTGVCSAVAWASARGLGPPLVRTACGRGRNPTSLLGVASALR